MWCLSAEAAATWEAEPASRREASRGTEEGAGPPVPPPSSLLAARAPPPAAVAAKAAKAAAEEEPWREPRVGVEAGEMSEPGRER